MQFRRRRNIIPPALRNTGNGGAAPGASPELYLITFDMMRKGTKFRRRCEMVRQYALVQDGSVRLVTSGDTVERAVYEALIAAGVIAEASPLPGGGH